MTRRTIKRLHGRDFDMRKRKDRMAWSAMRRNGARGSEPPEPRPAVTVTKHATECGALYGKGCDCDSA